MVLRHNALHVFQPLICNSQAVLIWRHLPESKATTCKENEQHPLKFLQAEWEEERNDKVLDKDSSLDPRLDPRGSPRPAV